jgi:quercetin dioxygenase-like cupin family protein
VCRASVGKTREKEKMELVNLGGFSIARVTLEPGWSWEKYVKPQEKTDSCQVSHTSLILSGRLRTIMDDGTVIDRGPGDVGIVPPGHNTWLSEMNMHRNRLLRDRGVYQGT